MTPRKSPSSQRTRMERNHYKFDDQTATITGKDNTRKNRKATTSATSKTAVGTSKRSALFDV